MATRPERVKATKMYIPTNKNMDSKSSTDDTSANNNVTKRNAKHEERDVKKQEVDVEKIPTQMKLEDTSKEKISKVSMKLPGHFVSGKEKENHLKERKDYVTLPKGFVSKTDMEIRLKERKLKQKDSSGAKRSAVEKTNEVLNDHVLDLKGKSSSKSINNVDIAITNETARHSVSDFKSNASSNGKQKVSTSVANENIRQRVTAHATTNIDQYREVKYN
ncbi:hypothetical protein DPMN_187338 [Dreissena polymorpha]|uniref:Uncharacterized protein n=1 Tax=Dreissena polymorpha TaxID=45954 RepID=A0A9D4IAC3_DREPO|nr:hypothetical protein DPMN_187338 [Dreissena polymorpha]